MRRLIVIAALVLASGAGCVTPSIPIPPPDPAKMTFTLTVQDLVSTAVLSYPPDKNYQGGVVYVFNHDTNMGVFQGVNADFSIGPTQPLRAVAGNQLVVTIEAVDQTVSRCVVLREGQQDPNTYCNF